MSSPSVGVGKRSPAMGHHPAIAWSGRIPSTTVFSRSAWVLLDSTHSLLRGFTVRLFFLSGIGMDLDLGPSCAQFALRSGLGCGWQMEECMGEEEWWWWNGDCRLRKRKSGGGNVQLRARKWRSAPHWVAV